MTFPKSSYYMAHPESLSPHRTRIRAARGFVVIHFVSHLLPTSTP